MTCLRETCRTREITYADLDASDLALQVQEATGNYFMMYLASERVSTLRNLACEEREPGFGSGGPAASLVTSYSLVDDVLT